jgi:diaminohydroxyphosphoribosylaminopyrimidine deaminase/5-amino-6-(5-phosphoribosylamino)uracil reductase
MDCCRQPLRVVVGLRDSLASGSALLRSVSEGPVLVVEAAPRGKSGTAVQPAGIEVAEVACGPDGRPAPRAVAQLLATRGVQTILLEGGPRLAGAWWAAGLIDKIACFICPKVAPGTEHRGALHTAGPAVMGEGLALREVEVRQSGQDVLMVGYTGDVY